MLKNSDNIKFIKNWFECKILWIFILNTHIIEQGALIFMIKKCLKIKIRWKSKFIIKII